MQAVRGVFILKTRLKKPTRVAEVRNIIIIKEMDPHGWGWTVVIAAAPGVVWNSGCYVHYKVRKCQLIVGRKVTYPRSRLVRQSQANRRSEWPVSEGWFQWLQRYLPQHSCIMEITNKYDVQNRDKHAFILRNNAVWGATRLYGMLLERNNPIK